MNQTEKQTLMELLKEFGATVIPLPDPEPPTFDEISQRFSDLCRGVYTSVRKSFETEKSHCLLRGVIEGYDRPDGIGASCAMLHVAFETYIKLKMEEDFEKFKKEFIFAVDKAVELTHKELLKVHEARTKPSTSDGSSESSETS